LIPAEAIGTKKHHSMSQPHGSRTLVGCKILILGLHNGKKLLDLGCAAAPASRGSKGHKAPRWTADPSQSALPPPGKT